MFKIYGSIIHLTRGDSFASEISIIYDGEPYVPSEYDTITFALKKDYEDAEPLVTKTIPHDTMEIQLDPSDTNTLEHGRYVYDVDIVFEDGTKDTFKSGVMYLTPEV